MLRIYQWISGRELMERWQVKPLDLVNVVINERLPVYEPDGRLAEYKGEDAVRANHPDPFPPLPKKDNPSIYDVILNPEAYDFEIPGISIPPEYIPLPNRIEHLMFKLIEVERFEKENKVIICKAAPEGAPKDNLAESQKEPVMKESVHLDDVMSGVNISVTIQKKNGNSIPKNSQLEPKKERKRNKFQIAKEKVREKAKEFWDADPTMTIEDIIHEDAINRITMEIIGRILSADTLREWIKDLCPNRKPGRRPENKSMKQGKNLSGPEHSLKEVKGK